MKTTSLEVRKRIATLFFLFIFALLALAVRFSWVQLVQGESLAKMALDNRMRDIVVPAKRGILFDRNGHELAISISTDSIYANPADIRKSHRGREIAQKMASVLGMDEEKLYQRITRQASFVWVKRQIEFKQARKLKKMDLPGIGFSEESRRFYPKGLLACHILGFSGIDNVGLDGLDLYYNKEVGGVNGRIVIEHDGIGREIPEATHRYIPPRDGYNLILTIDETIQYVVERELDKVMASRKPKGAFAIVMDSATGEVLALANRPGFDPNQYGKYTMEDRRNRAVSDVFEPGSTMKILTASAAMEEGAVHVHDRFFCPGYIKVGIETIKCAHSKAHGAIDFGTAVAESCNVSFVQVGLKLGIDPYYRYLKAFGFGEKTGIDLPGEARGILIPKARVKQIDLATMSMGQANAVTAVQLTSTCAAIANNGLWLKPHLVREIRDAHGKTIRKIGQGEGRQVISRQTAAELRKVLEKVVEEGSGKNTYIEGYKIAGKTGTAQKIAPNGGYLQDQYVASFLGFAPADKPRLVCMVVVDSPQGYPYYGGQVAAPVFREIMRDSLRYLEVPMSDMPVGQPENQQPVPIAPKNRTLVPDVVNLTPREAILLIQRVGLKAKIEGEGDVVWSQTPRAYTDVQKESTVIANLSAAPAVPNGARVTVPDLRGKSMRDVARILSRLGLHMDAKGYGLVIKQTPAPGEKIQQGATVQVYFQPLQ
ncbi:MAG: stage V sporulation protein D [Solirubrobacterales bacterium]